MRYNITVVGAGGTIKGVDSLHESQSVSLQAKELARTSGSIVVVSGEVDVITDGSNIAFITGNRQLVRTP